MRGTACLLYVSLRGPTHLCRPDTMVIGLNCSIQLSVMQCKVAEKVKGMSYVGWVGLLDSLSHMH